MPLKRKEQKELDNRLAAARKDLQDQLRRSTGGVFSPMEQAAFRFESEVTELRSSEVLNRVHNNLNLSADGRENGFQNRGLGYYTPRDSWIIQSDAELREEILTLQGQVALRGDRKQETALLEAMRASAERLKNANEEAAALRRALDEQGISAAVKAELQTRLDKAETAAEPEKRMVTACRVGLHCYTAERPEDPLTTLQGTDLTNVQQVLSSAGTASAPEAGEPFPAEARFILPELPAALHKNEVQKLGLETAIASGSINQTGGLLRTDLFFHNLLCDPVQQARREAAGLDIFDCLYLNGKPVLATEKGNPVLDTGGGRHSRQFENGQTDSRNDDSEPTRKYSQKSLETRQRLMSDVLGAMLRGEHLEVVRLDAAGAPHAVTLRPDNQMKERTPGRWEKFKNWLTRKHVTTFQEKLDAAKTGDRDAANRRSDAEKNLQTVLTASARTRSLAKMVRDENVTFLECKNSLQETLQDPGKQAGALRAKTGFGEYCAYFLSRGMKAEELLIPGPQDLKKCETLAGEYDRLRTGGTPEEKKKAADRMVSALGLTDLPFMPVDDRSGIALHYGTVCLYQEMSAALTSSKDPVILAAMTEKDSRAADVRRMDTVTRAQQDLGWYLTRPGAITDRHVDGGELAVAIQAEAVLNQCALCDHHEALGHKPAMYGDIQADTDKINAQRRGNIEQLGKMLYTDRYPYTLANGASKDLAIQAAGHFRGESKDRSFAMNRDGSVSLMKPADAARQLAEAGTREQQRFDEQVKKEQQEMQAKIKAESERQKKASELRDAGEKKLKAFLKEEEVRKHDFLEKAEAASVREAKQTAKEKLNQLRGTDRKRTADFDEKDQTYIREVMADERNRTEDRDYRPGKTERVGKLLAENSDVRAYVDFVKGTPGFLKSLGLDDAGIAGAADQKPAYRQTEPLLPELGPGFLRFEDALHGPASAATATERAFRLDLQKQAEEQRAQWALHPPADAEAAGKQVRELFAGAYDRLEEQTAADRKLVSADAGEAHRLLSQHDKEELKAKDTFEKKAEEGELRKVKQEAKKDLNENNHPRKPIRATEDFPEEEKQQIISRVQTRRGELLMQNYEPEKAKRMESFLRDHPSVTEVLNAENRLAESAALLRSKNVNLLPEARQADAVRYRTPEPKAKPVLPDPAREKAVPDKVKKQPAKAMH